MRLHELIIPVLFLGISLPFDSRETTIIVKYLNVRNEKGNMMISLYDAPDQFPYKPKWKYMISKTKLKEQGNRFRIDQIESGKYALATFDDENCDTVMQKNFLGIPKEGYGFSNNIKPSIKGAPTFEECTFFVGEGAVKTIEIEIQYLFREEETETR